MIENEHPYQVDGEAGRFTFITHSIFTGDSIGYDTSKSIFPSLTGKEWYRTCGFNEIAIVYGTTEESYRKTSELINRIRYQEGATPSRTLRDNTELEGRRLSEAIEVKCAKILKENGFTSGGAYEGSDKGYMKQSASVLLCMETSEAIERCRIKARVEWEEWEIAANPVIYEDPHQTVNVSIDDVVVKQQKECRNPSSPKDTRERKYVHNTLAHIENAGRSYIVNSHGIANTIKLLISFLVHNDLLKCRIQFFTDGHRVLISTIFSCFSWFGNIGLILDWYHLEKKCKEQLSLALNGRHIRNEILGELTGLLWCGLVDRSMECLRQVDAGSIKNEKALEGLISYLQRNKPYIPCYAVRKELGLRNSSNVGEKMNDLVVSDRQKHNGMSWSKCGSVALASLKTLVRNREHTRWFESEDITFRFAA